MNEQSARRPTRASDRGTASPDHLLGFADTARYLGRSESFLRRLVARREIRHRKVGRLLKFEVADLDAFLAECVVDPREPLWGRRGRRAAGGERDGS